MPIAPVRATCVPPHAGQIEVLDVDQPQRALARRTPCAAAARAASSASANRIATGRSSQTMRLASSSAAVDLARRHLAREVDRRRRRRRGGSSRSAPRAADRTPPTARAGRCAAACDRTGAPSRSCPCTGARLERAVDDVQDRAVVAIDDVDDPRVAERAGVERLAAGRRIERRAIEHDRAAGRRATSTSSDVGVELAQVGVGVVEAFGHASRPRERGIGDAGLAQSRARAAGSCRSGRTGGRPASGS